ncbi:hypothetical protein BpHYR1_020581 [Brachionus plicatilis]|uniref:Uncharacterized protein n=1 Tax=Brachionus plicatilis TaxID=10195 RepID=A0A3M7PIE7_BRAPC|nr:hypothetical protein BpHYR1_020581 [Brachionus plicatilis]
MSTLVHFVVGELDLFKRHNLLVERVASERAIWMDKESGLDRGVGLASDQPRRPVIGVPVALAVSGHNVHGDQVLLVQLGIAERDPERREHSASRFGDYHLGAELSSVSRKHSMAFSSWSPLHISVSAFVIELGSESSSWDWFDLAGLALTARSSSSCSLRFLGKLGDDLSSTTVQ